jgi:hypothetical protein
MIRIPNRESETLVAPAKFWISRHLANERNGYSYTKHEVSFAFSSAHLAILCFASTASEEDAEFCRIPKSDQTEISDLHLIP